MPDCRQVNPIGVARSAGSGPARTSALSVVFAAAHAGFAGLNHPLGGGEAIANWLCQEWVQSQPFALSLVGPGPIPPPGVRYHRLPDPAPSDLTRLSEWQYARFCRRFGGGVTRFLLDSAPGPAQHPTVALINDLAEGPDFGRLAAAGIPVVTILHVDVVDYFCRIYLSGHVRPEAMTRLYEQICRRGLEPFVPAILRLVFGQQRDAVRHSRKLVVPSSGMARVLERCYPGLPTGRICVLPWGCRRPSVPASVVESARQSLLEMIGPLRRPVLLTLSRISPEKGLDTLMAALAMRDESGASPVTVIVAGEAAYMRGRAFLRRVQSMAQRLTATRVHFTGFADPAMKEALFSLADLYVFPSRHESYGLTLCEALAAGLPVITTDHYSAADLAPKGASWVAPRDCPAKLARAIDEACERLPPRGSFAAPPSFAQAAGRLAQLLQQQARQAQP